MSFVQKKSLGTTGKVGHWCGLLREPQSKKCTVAAAIALAATWGLPNAAAAAIATHTYSFVASDFSPASAPQDPVVGSFTLSFDPAGSDVADSQIGIHLNSINIQFDSTNISYDYLSGVRDLVVGGIQAGADQVQSNTNDFFIAFFVDDAGNPVIDASHTALFSYSQTTITPADIFSTSAVDVSVPEPGTLGLMFVPLLWLFASCRRCRVRGGGIVGHGAAA